MPDNMLTKCPHCGTTFRLTVEQLKVAGGAVRCGACYHVFHAAGHLVQPSSGGQPQTTRPTSSDDDGLNDSVTKAPVSFDTHIPQLANSEPDPEPAKPNNDEAWAEALLEEMGEKFDPADAEPKPSAGSTKKTSGAKPGLGQSELSDTFMNLGNYANNDPFAIHDFETDDDSELDTKDDESWAKAMLDELEQDSAPGKQDNGLAILMDDSNPNPSKSRSYDSKPRLRTSSAIKHVNPMAGEHSSATRPKPSNQQAAANPPPPKDDNGQAFIRNFDDSLLTDEKPLKDGIYADSEDIEHRQARLHQGREFQPHSGTGTSTKWLIPGILVLLVALAGQFLYFQWDKLAAVPQLRPAMAAMCDALGCKLPIQVDVNQVVSNKLVVRSHPSAANSLVIDAVIENQASFVQPFPDIKLSFSDINGNPVASRRFSPMEYITDPLVDPGTMPSRTPIHLNLEIVDPGKQAVNYRLTFLPQS